MMDGGGGDVGGSGKRLLLVVVGDGGGLMIDDGRVGGAGHGTSAYSARILFLGGRGQTQSTNAFEANITIMPWTRTH